MSNDLSAEVNLPQSALDVPLASAGKTVLDYLRFFTSTPGRRYALRIAHGDFYVMLRHDVRDRSVVRLWMWAEQVGATLLSQLLDWGFKKPEHTEGHVVLAWDLTAAPLEVLAERLLSVLRQAGEATDEAVIHVNLFNDAPATIRVVGFVATLAALLALSLYLILARIPPFYIVFRWVDSISSPAVAGGAVFVMVAVIFLVLFGLGSWIVRTLRLKRRKSDAEGSHL